MEKILRAIPTIGVSKRSPLTLSEDNGCAYLPDEEPFDRIFF
jgi:hypothetical protein